MSVAEFEGRRVLQEAPQGLWNDAWSRLRRNPSALVGFVLVGIFTAMAIFAPIIAPYGPREVVAPLTDAFQSPSTTGPVSTSSRATSGHGSSGARATRS